MEWLYALGVILLLLTFLVGYIVGHVTGLKESKTAEETLLKVEKIAEDVREHSKNRRSNNE